MASWCTVCAMTSGDELRAKRHAAGLTQARLGELLGVTPSAVGQWETGATEPSWQMQQKLAEVFDGVTPSLSRLDQLEAKVMRLTEMVENLLGPEADDAP